MLKKYHDLNRFLQILVDWGAIAINSNNFEVQACSQDVADEIANFLNFLVDNDMTTLSTLVMSGHSIGLQNISD